MQIVDKLPVLKANESTKVSSNESMRVNATTAEVQENNSYIRKTFSGLFFDLKKTFERKSEEYELGLKIKKVLFFVT